MREQDVDDLLLSAACVKFADMLLQDLETETEQQSSEVCDQQMQKVLIKYIYCISININFAAKKQHLQLFYPHLLQFSTAVNPFTVHRFSKYTYAYNSMRL